MKTMSGIMLASLALSSMTAGLAAADGDDDDEPVKQAVPWKATGTHECHVAGSSIRHTCDVSGEGYRTCAAARAALEADDCCPRSPGGGSSIDFLNFACSPM